MNDLIEKVREELKVAIAPSVDIDKAIDSLRKEISELEIKRQSVINEANRIAKKAPYIIVKVQSRFKPPFRSYYYDDCGESKDYYEEGEELTFSMDFYGRYVFYAELEDGVIKFYYSDYSDYLYPPEFIYL